MDIEKIRKKKKFTQHLSLGHVVLAIGVMCRHIVSAYNEDICVACRGQKKPLFYVQFSQMPLQNGLLHGIIILCLIIIYDEG